MGRDNNAKSRRPVASCSSPRRCAFVVIAFAAAGCTSTPFTADRADYAQRVALSRLREIPPADLGRYLKPPPPPDTPAPDPLAEARRRFEGLAEVALSLEQCRASALEHNLGLKVALIDPAIARERVSQEEARFESAFTLRGAWRDQDSPTFSSLDSNTASVWNITPGVRIPLRTGGEVSVGLPVTRSESDNTFSTLNPAYTTDLEFTISHQLLRGAGRRANTASLRIAGYDEQAAAARTKLEVVRQLAAVDRSYWRLFQARRELEVAQQQYELANEQLGRADRRHRAGAIAELEGVRAQAAVANRLELIIIAQNNVLLQQRELKRVINTPGLPVDGTAMIVPTTPPDPVQFVFSPAELAAHAVANRMEMLELELSLAADAARIAFARNQALPLLALNYTYRVNGLGGSATTSFNTLRDNHFEDWELGLSAELPIGNEAAESRIRQAILARLQRLNTRDAREQAIRKETLDAINSIEAGWQRILAARQAVIMNTRALQAEQRQFDVGNTVGTFVLDATTRLADSQFAEARALADYQIAQVDLAFATGTLLGAARVTWQPPDPPPLDTPDPAERLP